MGDFDREQSTPDYEISNVQVLPSFGESVNVAQNEEDNAANPLSKVIVDRRNTTADMPIAAAETVTID